MTAQRRGVAVALALALALAAFAAPGATAAKKKKKKKAKPVETTLYFHGAEVIGETESFSIIADGYLPMDANEPEGTSTKSKQITNGVVTPNVQCAGNALFPVWIGDLSGSIRGDVTVSFQTVATPGSVDVRIWPDIASLLCTSTAAGTSDYPEPAGEVRVDLPPGQGTVEAVIEDVNFKASSVLMLQITPVLVPPFFGRVFYDSSDVASNVTFMCTPAKGKSCTP